MKKLAIVTTHPIQYYAPIFKLLAQRRNIQIKVFYTWGEESKVIKFDPGFGKQIKWDLPLLEGYDYEFLFNTSKRPGSDHFFGIKNPDAISRIKDYAPDAILIYGWANQSHFKIIRYFKGKIAIFFRGDSTLLDTQSNLKQAFRTIFLKWVYSHIDHAFYVGSANRDYFIKFGLSTQQLTFAPHAIDNDRFSKKPDSDKLRFRLGLQDDDVLILFAGKLEPKKNPEALLKVFAELEQSNVNLLFAGNGTLENILKKKSKKIKNSAKIHFIDFQNQLEMPAVYHACDIFCLPSLGPGETWGLAVNEAMAASKPILVSDKAGCASDLVQDHYNGNIFKSDDVNHLKNSLATLCNDKSSLIEMGKRSFEIIEKWSFTEQVKAIENTINGYR